MNNGRTRSYLMGVVGGYLIYQAYQLYQSRIDPDTTMSPAMRIIFIVFFVLTGIALLAYAVILWKNSGKEQEKEKEKEDENNLKS